MKILDIGTTCVSRQLLLSGMFVLLVSITAQAKAASPSMIWLDQPHTPDSYVAFRGTFIIADESEVELRTLGSGWYSIWLDGTFLLEGPDRFDVAHPQYQVTKLTLSEGPHVIAVQAHHLGVTTRILMDMPPFMYCDVIPGGHRQSATQDSDSDKPIAVEWKCLPLNGYKPQVRRINPQLGWIEWCDTRNHPANWQLPGFDDSQWSKPALVQPKLGPLAPTSIGTVQTFTHTLKVIGEGDLAETFGYESDDIAARFFLRDLECKTLPRQGKWKRYDLGRVRLGRPQIALAVPPGTVVEFAYAETLQHGRVSPWITLSAGGSCNLDHFVARGGLQEFSPLTPKGGRYLEVHVLLPSEHAEPVKRHDGLTYPIAFHREEYIERVYHGPAVGSFACNDPLLNRIWEVGVETFRACCEDALVDNPTRERGQWTGDVVTVGMDINAAAYSDLRLCRRGLMQSAWCAREDGLIAGLCPGGPAYLATYAAQWVDACMHYHELTGDKRLLEEMYPSAVRNIDAMERFFTAEGVTDGAGWVFVDWGYARNAGPADMGYNLHVLSTLRSMAQWCHILGKNDAHAKYQQLSGRLERIIRQWLSSQTTGQPGQAASEAIGYHCAVLAMRLGLIDKSQHADYIAYIKKHILGCFPNNPDAPRLSDPSVSSSQLITPYFAHYAFPVLIEHGEVNFVLDQYRKCWGWALEDDRTTWLEVFDTRWSHCHQWAGCPTWQLSRYVLGLHNRFDLGPDRYVLKVHAGSLTFAKGSLPVPNSEGMIHIDWKHTPAGIEYSLKTDKPIWLYPGSTEAMPIRVEHKYQTVLP